MGKRKQGEDVRDDFVSLVIEGTPSIGEQEDEGGDIITNHVEIGMNPFCEDRVVTTVEAEKGISLARLCKGLTRRRNDRSSTSVSDLSSRSSATPCNVDVPRSGTT